MKAYQIAALALAALGALASAAPKKQAPGELGNVLYIGDSITHGFGAPSYRWALHKIFVDNGIAYDEIGVETGNRNNGEQPGTMYIGRPFKNVHAAMSSERAYEVSNRIHPSGNRLDDSSVFHWLGLPKDAEGKEVTPIDKRKLSVMPDTCFILLGTNDMLSDYGNKGGIGKNIAQAEKALLDKKKGDMSVIVNAIRQANAKAKVVILEVPTWGKRDMNNTEKDYKSVVSTYNKKLAKAFKKETVVNINKGLVDICCEDMPLCAVKDFFNADMLHPNRQGDLIIAGHVARAMGYAGRSAGAPRKAAAGFGSHAADILERATEKKDVESSGDGLALKAGAKLVSPWPDGADTAGGFTVELQANVGNGAVGGWETDGNVALAIGNGKHSGKLLLAEGYIRWHNGAVLYPVNMSDKKVEPIRVAWIPGSALHNVSKGFYVWLGDMLIGEALPDDAAKLNGIVLENLSSKDETIQRLSVEDKPCAPATKAAVKEEALLIYDEDKPEPAPAAKK